MKQRQRAKQEVQESCALLQGEKDQLQEQVATLQTTALRLQGAKAELERTLLHPEIDHSSRVLLCLLPKIAGIDSLRLYRQAVLKKDRWITEKNIVLH